MVLWGNMITKYKSRHRQSYEKIMELEHNHTHILTHKNDKDRTTQSKTG